MALDGRVFVSNRSGEDDDFEGAQKSRLIEYNAWDDTSMVKAMTAVEMEGLPIRRASEMYGVPRSTLYDRISGKVQHGSRSGAPSYLNHMEELELAHFLIRCSEIGFPHTIAQVLGIVQQCIDYKGLNKKVTYGWWQKFCQRHTEISLCTAVPLSKARSMAADPECIERYFDILEDTLRKNRIFNDPMRIYNCDETGVPLNPKGVKVITKRGSKNAHCVSGESKTQITVLACTCASGAALPPMVIFDRQTLNPELTTGEVPGTIYGLSPKGWINRELFMSWFYKHFIPNIPPTRPIILLMDGHSSHYAPDVIRLAAEEKIILFTLPPNTTHISQPLDRGCFSPLKTVWKKVCHEFTTANPGRIVSRYDFSSLFSTAWKLSMTPSNIASSYKVCGVYPFSPYQVISRLPSKTTCSFEPESLLKKTGLAYIPLYSPPPAGRLKPSKSVTHLMDDELDSSLLSISPLEKSFSDNDLHMLSTRCRATSISRFLVTPNIPKHCDKPRSYGKVLTSAENLSLIEEKQRLKMQAEKEKQLKKAAREAKREAKKNKPKKKSEGKSTEHFTEEENRIFSRRFENGWDLKHDHRYNLWLKQYKSSGDSLLLESSDSHNDLYKSNYDDMETYNSSDSNQSETSVAHFSGRKREHYTEQQSEMTDVSRGRRRGTTPDTDQNGDTVISNVRGRGRPKGKTVDTEQQSEMTDVSRGRRRGTTSDTDKNGDAVISNVRGRGRPKGKTLDTEQQSEMTRVGATGRGRRTLDPVYCWCQREEFGEMILCENSHCSVGWFHFECVHITNQDLQKKKWFCSNLCKNYEKASLN